MQPGAEWMTAAMSIVDDWEQTHNGRLLSTAEPANWST